MKFRKIFSIISLTIALAAVGTWCASAFAAGSLELGWRGQRNYTLYLGYDRPGWFARLDIHAFPTAIFTGGGPVLDATIDPPQTQLADAPLVDVSTINWSLARRITASVHHVVIILAAGLAWAVTAFRGGR